MTPQQVLANLEANVSSHSPNIWTTVLYACLLITGTVGFLVMAYDKSSAGYGGGRVREMTLWWIAFIGGALGMTAAQYLFNHKGNKLLFMAPVWGAAFGWLLLLLTVGGYPWWTHLSGHG
jgi:uncharacterized membrane protein YsdA (DUF1294 family)